MILFVSLVESSIGKKKKIPCPFKSNSSIILLIKLIIKFTDCQ